MNRNIVKITIALAIWGIGEGMFILFQPLYLQTLGADPIMIGSVLGGMGLAMTVAHIPAGYLADRIGRRPLLWVGWILATLATWIMATAKTLPFFVIGTMLYGLTAFVAGPLNGYITLARGKWSVVRALTLVLAIYNAGAILGPLIGGWIGESIGLRWSFVIAGILFICSTIFVLQIENQPDEEISSGSFQYQWTEIFNKRYLTYLLIVFFTLFSLYSSQPLSQNFLQNERGVSLGLIGQLLAARSAGVVVFNLALGQINARYGFILTQLAMGLFSIFILNGSSPAWYFAGYFMLGSYQTSRIMVTAQGRALVNANRMGLAYGIFETVGSFAAICGAPLAGYLFSIQPGLPYRFSLVGIGFSIIISSLFIPIKASELH